MFPSSARSITGLLATAAVAGLLLTASPAAAVAPASSFDVCTQGYRDDVAAGKAFAGTRVSAAQKAVADAKAASALDRENQELKDAYRAAREALKAVKATNRTWLKDVRKAADGAKDRCRVDGVYVSVVSFT
jgi:hypothetical protein